MRIRLTFAALVGIVATAVSAPAASADRLTVAIDGDAAGQAKYTGKLRTKRDACDRRRTVQVYDASDNGGYFIGETKTGNRGRYSLHEFAPPPGEQVRVLVTEKRKRRGSCPSVTRTVTVPDDPAVP